MKQQWINVLLNLSRILFGCTFLFSGFVKAVDPMGSAFKFIDYFRAFDLNFFTTFALPLAVLLAALEFTIGACVLFGSFRRVSTALGLLFMLFFTPLTLYLAIANPVKDCGCFGDAFILTNWETFYKNIILLAMAVFLFIKRESIQPLFRKSLRGFVAFYALVFSVSISQIGISFLPILDFRPFKTGINIPEAMHEDIADATYVLIYAKDGKEKEFSLENYPSEESGWTFVESKMVLPENRDEATIKDFFITNGIGEDITEELLRKPEFTFLLISPDWATADDNYSDRINEIYEYALEKGYDFYGISVNDKIKETEWSEGTGAEYPYLYSDATILETIIRANPGLVLLKEGTILWKKNASHLPDNQFIDKSIELSHQGIVKKSNSKMIILFIVLLFFGPILILLCFEKTFILLFKKWKQNKRSSKRTND
ncbi:MAG: BT_3928 family protein [Bacteroidales bacterium]